jgi:hypothetical protein
MGSLRSLAVEPNAGAVSAPTGSTRVHVLHGNLRVRLATAVGVLMIIAA